MEKTPLFHASGVCPLPPAISPTLVFTVSNMPDRFPVIPSMSSPPPTPPQSAPDQGDREPPTPPRAPPPAFV